MGACETVGEWEEELGGGGGSNEEKRGQQERGENTNGGHVFCFLSEDKRKQGFMKGLEEAERKEASCFLVRLSIIIISRI